MKAKLMIGMEDSTEVVITENTLPPVDIAKGDELLPVELLTSPVDPEESIDDEYENHITQINNLSDGIDDGFEVVTTLDAVACNLNSSIIKGDAMGPCASNALNTALEYLLSTIGSKPVRVLPAMEMFGGKLSKLEATKLAMEDIKSTIKTIWEKIKAAIKKLMEWINELFNLTKIKINKISNRITKIKNNIFNKDILFLDKEKLVSFTKCFYDHTPSWNKVITGPEIVKSFSLIMDYCENLTPGICQVIKDGIKEFNYTAKTKFDNDRPAGYNYFPVTPSDHAHNDWLNIVKGKKENFARENITIFAKIIEKIHPVLLNGSVSKNNSIVSTNQKGMELELTLQLALKAITFTYSNSGIYTNDNFHNRDINIKFDTAKYAFYNEHKDNSDRVKIMVGEQHDFNLFESKFSKLNKIIDNNKREINTLLTTVYNVDTDSMESHSTFNDFNHLHLFLTRLTYVNSDLIEYILKLSKELTVYFEASSESKK